MLTKNDMDGRNMPPYKIYHWFIHFLFTSPSRMILKYGDVTIAGERLQNLYIGLCSAVRAFEQGGIHIVPQLL
jgi:hypothetical protein